MKFVAAAAPRHSSSVTFPSMRGAFVARFASIVADAAGADVCPAMADIDARPIAPAKSTLVRRANLIDTRTKSSISAWP